MFFTKIKSSLCSQKQELSKISGSMNVNNLYWIEQRINVEIIEALAT